MMHIGKLMIVAGIVLIVLGGLWILFGRLPGDFMFKKGNTTFYFPIMTSIIASIVLSIIMYLFNRFN
ncbi:DUF2905 domain-containing protein [Aciduricibacillus chroicocephali]|uniref:DUF2905 domain-containing protein n=2 Tax=Aciduricibacillus chroicocephali TaxID=3054939 RepID=A0ABY9KZC2_9BACI|nr:DUF2905 domain-containing protein [Bacillaceae bacterium 44XB]